MYSAQSQRETMRPRRSSPWLGYWLKGPGSFPFRARPSSIDSRRTSAHCRSISPQMSCVISTAPSPRSVCEGQGTPNSWRDWSGDELASRRQFVGKEPVVLFFDHRIAFAAAFLQPRTVEYCDVAACVTDQ